EMGTGDVSALVAFQATLPAPVQVLPANPALRAAAERGESLFGQIGCGACHVKALPLDSALFTDPGPYDAAGTLNAAGVDKPYVIDLAKLPWVAALPHDAQGRILVPLYGDLKRHKIADEAQPFYANELLSQRFVGRDEFLAARLWGLGSTAPYGHRGDVTTI